MANLSPIKLKVPSSVGDLTNVAAAAQQKLDKKRDEDDFEDSLNVSISEHISEEIESSAVEDSIEKPAPRFDRLAAEKKRKLFDFDDSDQSDGIDKGGIQMFTNLDESLSGDDIAKHFMVETKTNQPHTDVNEPVRDVSQRTKCDELKIADGNKGAANPTKTNAATSSKGIDEQKESKDISNLVAFVHQSDTHKSASDGNSNGKTDVILINDHEISIHSLKELQRQRSRSDIDQQSISQTNQNTTSEISDLQIEDNAKEQRSIDDLSINESSGKVESHSDDIDIDRSKSSSDKMTQSKSASQSEQHEETSKSEENIQKCKPVEEDSLPELSVIEEVSAADELSSRQNLVENSVDKKNAIRKIIDNVVEKLPLNKEHRPQCDDVLSMDSKNLNSTQSSTVTDGTVYNVFTKVPDLITASFIDEVSLNLLHMQNKMKELQNINAGKYSASFFDLPSSRRNSLRDSLKDFPQSGRDSSSITTNSTEYRPFPDEYSRVSKLFRRKNKTTTQIVL